MKRIEFEGKTHEFPDDFTDADIATALGGEASPAPSAGPTPSAPPSPAGAVGPPPTLMERAGLTAPRAAPSIPRRIPDPFVMGGKALSAVMAPLKGAYELAGRADVAAGIKTPEQAASRAQTYTNVVPPLLAGILTRGASVPGQSLAQMATTQAMQGGQMEPQSPGQVLLSGAMPVAGAAVGRLGRGVGRAATRFVPSLFESAQSKAQAAAGAVGEHLRPETAAGNLFRGARAAGGDAIPAANIQRVIGDLGESIGDDPLNPGLQMVRAYADKLGQATASGTVDLKTLMQMRRDLGLSLGKTSELSGLYGAILSDLEAAAAQGGPGANLATSALQAFKQELGSQKFAELVQQATKESIAGGKGLNMATLNKLVNTVPKGKTEPELLRLLGPEKFQSIANYIDKFRALPPAMAYTLGNMGLTSLATGAGALTSLGALPAAIGLEIGRNAAFGGHNPAALNAILGTGASMGRAAAAPQVPKETR